MTRILTALALAAAAIGAQAAPQTKPTSAPLTVYVAGDIADCRYSRPEYSGAAQTAAIIQAGDPQALVLSLGDHTYPAGTPEEFRDCYAPTWGQFRERTYPTPGNHEYSSGTADGYYGYFGNAAGQRGRGYYSFDKAGWHVISLNSHMGGAEHQRQLLWLKDDLAAHPARCTLAYWHAPLYSSGGHSASDHMREAWRLLYEAGAELVLSGHDHDYERFAPQDADGKLDEAQGLRQFVVGTGGAFLTPFRWIADHSEVRHNWRHGVLKLQLKENGYAWEFLAVDDVRQGPQAREARDSGAASCH
jgi:3',5'-cyclic AMP phosphodiesterase CpdA